MSSVAFIGIDNMGASVAKTLVKTISYIVTIWNQTAHRPQVKAVVNAGAAFEPTIKTALASDIIVICVLDHDIIYRVLEPIGSSTSAISNKCIANVTNGIPRQAWEMQEWVKARGAG
jgi:3-hydroxyisobutyrate dehydrogenase-like beta-hydroxyacid dehydrogenase